MSIFDNKCIEGDQSNQISEVSEMSFDKDILEDILEDNLKSDLENILVEEIDSKEIASFPNEVYGDLMTLVTKHKLSNASGNAIIKFFNKHTNLATSPLPKSIKQGREYMDRMNLPNLTYYKTCVINYNKKEYYLHHRSLLSCIKNILSIPDISQNFALNFEKLEVIIYSINTDS